VGLWPIGASSLSTVPSATEERLRGAGEDHMTLRRTGDTWARLAIPRRRHTASVLAAALIGVFSAVGVLAFMGALLAPGVAGIDVFEADNLERLAASTVATAVILVLAAFFCGGWAYGALRGREARDRLGNAGDGDSDVLDPSRWANAGIRRRATKDDGRSMRWEGHWHQREGRARRYWRKFAGIDLDVAQFDEFAGRIR
jgi:hypothetical protein